MTTQQENQLNKIINNTFIYKGLEYTFLSFKMVNTTLVVKTNKRTLNFLSNEIDNFLSSLTPVVNSNKITVKKSEGIIPENVQYQKSDIHKKLENALSDMIDKVKDNKDAIPQATAICNITNSVVNLEKQQIKKSGNL